MGPTSPSPSKYQPQAPERVVVAFGVPALLLAGMGTVTLALGKGDAAAVLASTMLFIVSAIAAVITAAVGLRLLASHEVSRPVRLVAAGNLMLAIAGGTAFAYWIWQVVRYIVQMLYGLTHIQL